MASDDHLRRQIRDQVATMLAGLTTTGSNVFVTRAHPAEQANLPALLIYTLSETADLSTDDAQGVKTYRRTLELAVEGVAQGVSVDDVLDDIALEVEEAIEADPTLGGLAWDSALTDTSIDVSRDGKKEGGSVRLVYSITYYATAADPSSLYGG